jgi:hypothetical protein
VQDVQEKMTNHLGLVSNYRPYQRSSYAALTRANLAADKAELIRTHLHAMTSAGSGQ